ERIARLMTFVSNSEGERINRLMAYELVECSWEERSLTLAFPVEWWMLNPFEGMHGGLICTAFDIAFGTLSLTLSGMKQCPTAQLDVSFLQAVGLGDRLLVRVKANHMGRSLGNLTGEAISAKTGKVCATASTVFFLGGNGKVLS
ncbi:MAG: PaaI family thioesterase, partial [Oscillospiraceae bacterium]